jgi:hypothetical protein
MPNMLALFGGGLFDSRMMLHPADPCLCRVRSELIYARFE